MPVRGIRGATTATANTADAITEATDELLRDLVKANALAEAETCFAFFTTTEDLKAEFPAYAARRLGWLEVRLLCGHDMNGAPPNAPGLPIWMRIPALYDP